MTYSKPWKWPLATQIMVGLLIGATAGIIPRRALGDSAQLSLAIQNVIQPIGMIFLRLIFMMVIPLIVSAIVLGVTQIGDLRKLGRVGVRCFVVTVALASCSVAIGLLLVNWLQPGKQISEGRRAELVAQYASAASEKVLLANEKKPLSQTLIELIPTNPLAEAANAFAASA